MRGHCILSHGFESGPDATKVTALADAADRAGWTHERPDYTDLDAMREVTELGDVPARLQRLLALVRAAAARGPVVLAGSSLGAYISGLVSLQVPLAGLFLMAPPGTSLAESDRLARGYRLDRIGTHALATGVSRLRLRGQPVEIHIPTLSHGIGGSG